MRQKKPTASLAPLVEVVNSSVSASPGVSSAENDIFLFDRGPKTDGTKCLPRQRAASSERQTYSSWPGKTTRSCSCNAKGWLSTTVTTAVSRAEKMWLCWGRGSFHCFSLLLVVCKSVFDCLFFLFPITSHIFNCLMFE